MTRHINHGDQSWDNGKDIPQAHRAPKLLEPVAKPFSKVGPDRVDRVEKRGQSHSTTWPAHVQVQVIPGMERTDGLPKWLHTPQGTKVVGGFSTEWRTLRAGGQE